MHYVFGLSVRRTRAPDGGVLRPAFRQLLVWYATIQIFIVICSVEFSLKLDDDKTTVRLIL